MTTEEAIATAVTMLSETFRQPLTKIAASAYTLALEGLTPAEVSGALKKALRESKFMPSPAELLAFAGKGGQRSLTVRTANAWEEVRRAMDQWDYTGNVDFGPLTNAVVRNLGGWVSLCDKSIPDLVWVRKDFERIFEAFADKDPTTLHGEKAFPRQIGAICIPIDGEVPPADPRLQLEAQQVMARLIQGLADDKSAP